MKARGTLPAQGAVQKRFSPNEPRTNLPVPACPASSFLLVQGYCMASHVPRGSELQSSGLRVAREGLGLIGVWRFLILKLESEEEERVGRND